MLVTLRYAQCHSAFETPLESAAEEPLAKNYLWSRKLLSFHTLPQLPANLGHPPETIRGSEAESSIRRR